MKRTIILFTALIYSLAGAQNIESILSQIEDNNLELKALQESLNAQSEENIAATRLSNPELEFVYMYNREGILRQNYGASQSFDFADLTGARRTLAAKENELLLLEYKAARRDILTQGRDLVSEIIFRNAIIQEYEHRLYHARAVEASYKKGLESGQFSVLDYRKAQVDLLDQEGKYELYRIERDALLAELKALNGGLDISVDAMKQEIVALPGNFEAWLDQAARNSSAIAYLKANTSVSEQNLKLSKSESLPGLSIGYTSEILPMEAFRGVSVGISIPLWSSSKKVNAAKKQVQAAKKSEESALTRFRIDAKAQYDKAMLLEETVNKYRAIADSKSIVHDLDKALQAGEISLIEYVSELTFLYDTRELAYSLQLEHALAVNRLLSLEM